MWLFSHMEKVHSESTLYKENLCKYGINRKKSIDCICTHKIKKKNYWKFFWKFGSKIKIPILAQSHLPTYSCGGHSSDGHFGGQIGVKNGTKDCRNSPISEHRTHWKGRHFLFLLVLHKLYFFDERSWQFCFRKIGKQKRKWRECLLFVNLILIFVYSIS